MPIYRISNFPIDFLCVVRAIAFDELVLLGGIRCLWCGVENTQHVVDRVCGHGGTVVTESYWNVMMGKSIEVNETLKCHFYAFVWKRHEMNAAA